MRSACIDIGSNTTRLLVAEPDGPRLLEVVADRVFTRIGAAAAPDGTIPAAKIAEVAQVVEAQVRLAHVEEARRLRVVATAAIRRAPNARDLCDAVTARAGVTVDVLAPEEEARLAFLGATGSCPGATADAADVALADDPVAVVDLGGGSTEIVVGTPAGGVTWLRSVPVGSSTDDPGAVQAIASLAVPPVRRAVAVGGSATSVRLLVGDVLDAEALDRALRVLAAAAPDAVAREHGLHPDRVRMLPAGLRLLRAVGEALGGVPLQVGRGGLREGVILEHLRSAQDDARGSQPPGA